MNTNNRRKGATLALATAFALFFVVMLVGLFWVSMYFGGEREATNAGDSGALNVGKMTATLSVPLPSGDPTTNFSDVADSSGNVSLTNINRVWAKGLLAAINAQQMDSEGASGSGDADAQTMQQDAQQISDSLTAKLCDPDNLTAFYLKYASVNSVRMLGLQSQVDVPSDMNWTQSYLDRNYESNIQIDSSQFPVNFPTGSIKTMPSSNDPAHQYLVGYYPYSVESQNFWQVPFRVQERPHLVSRTIFEQSQDPTTIGPPAWTNAVPDAFGTFGATVKNRQYGLSTNAWVQTNPQINYPIAMPNGYVRILIDNNNLQWVLWMDGIPIPLWTDNYGFTPLNEVDFPAWPLGCGSVSVEEFVGNEYPSLDGPTLFQAIYALPPIAPLGTASFNYLLQRVDELHPGYTSAQLIGLLNSITLQPDSENQEFVIYNSDFSQTSTVQISTLSGAPSNVQGDPDGSQQSLEPEIPSPITNWGITTEECYGAWPSPTPTVVSATRNWTPGTGYSSNSSYGGCLGKLEVQRTTVANIIAVTCPCP